MTYQIKGVTILKKNNVYILVASYLLIMLVSFFYTFYMKGISYTDDRSIISEIPFLLLLVAMTSLYLHRYHNELALNLFFKRNITYFMISFIPLLVTLLVFWGNYFQFQLNFILPFIGTLLVGFGEEFLFRRTLLPHFLKTHSVHKAVIFSALIFGFCHSINVFAGANPVAVLVQVATTSFFGLYYGYLYLFTRKIAWSAIDHGLWDYLVINKIVMTNTIFSGIIGLQMLLRFMLTIVMIIKIRNNKNHTNDSQCKNMPLNQF